MPLQGCGTVFARLRVAAGHALLLSRLSCVRRFLLAASTEQEQQQKTNGHREKHDDRHQTSTQNFQERGQLPVRGLQT